MRSAAVQHWLYNARPTVLIRDPGRYYRLDVQERVARQREWNSPIYWPAAVGILVLGGLLWFALRSFKQRERTNARGEVLTA